MKINGATQCFSSASCDVNFVHKSSVVQLRDVPRRNDRVRPSMTMASGKTNEKRIHDDGDGDDDLASTTAAMKAHC
jgi:hypothetical protein